MDNKKFEVLTSDSIGSSQSAVLSNTLRSLATTDFN